MIKKLWVKFDDMDIECFCEEGRKKCAPESNPKCKEYVVKFIEIERDNNLEDIKKTLSKEERFMKELISKLKRHDTKLKHSINKFKI